MKYATRRLWQSPGFTLVVLATLGLSIGANTAIYSVVDAVLLRRLPYPEPQRLAMVMFNRHSARGDSLQDNVDGSTWEAIRDHASNLDAAVISGMSQGVNLVKDGRAEYVHQQRVSSGFFRVFGVAPLLGREFTREEDSAGGGPVVVLGHALWRRIFNGDPGAVGKGILLRGEPYTVVGVMPEGFRTDIAADLWTPLRPSRTGEGGGTNYVVIARLKPGVEWAAAEGQLDVVAKPQMALAVGKDTTVQTHLASLQEGATNNLRTPLLLTWAAVAIVLLIGCVNIAGLLLARASSRAREVATRMAIGASRATIVRQLLEESLLLSLIGGVFGIALGYAGIQGLIALNAQGFDLWYPVTLNWRVLLASFGIAVLTSLIFGLAPAITTSRVDLRAVLVEGGRGTAGRSRHWSRQALVAGEVALSLVLLVGAGLLLRTLDYLERQRPGFDPHNVTAASLSLQDARYNTSVAVNHLYDEGLRRIREIPGVEAAGVGLSLPYQRPLNSGFRIMSGRNADNQGRSTDVIYVTPGYFEALHVPLVSGRVVNGGDGSSSQKIAVVNQAFAKRFLKDQEPLGTKLRMGGRDLVDIVGVVGDTQQHSGTGAYGPMNATPTIYTPATQMSDGAFKLLHTWFSPQWVVRSQVAPESLARAMQSAVEAVDPQLPFASFKSMEAVQFNAFNRQRYEATIFSLLAGLALLLAAIGLYGLIAHSVSERRREMGIRMALGATAPRTMWTVVRPAAGLTLAGIVLGAALARASVTLLRDMLWGVPATDPTTFVAVAFGLLAVAVVASVIPALRLLRLDPAETLRAE